MDEGLRYRLASVGGVVALSGLSVVLVNNARVQTLVGTLPLLARLPVEPPGTTEFGLEVTTTIVAFLVAFVPLYKPRPRRILDTIGLVQKRALLAMTTLAAIGYFDYTYRLPRRTVLLITPLLFVLLPAWFVRIRRRPTEGAERVVVAGDDPGTIERVVRATDVPLVGYLCQTTAFDRRAERTAVSPAVADGGTGQGRPERIGGLSRIEDVLVDYDVDTVVLAFEDTDRAEFFGTLNACHKHGVAAKVHREHGDAVLTAEETGGPLVDVAVEPWDVQDYLVKRAFDVVFSVVGLVMLTPVIVGTAAAIKLDDGGPVFYRQERTAVFGGTFDVWKFRTMTPDGETATPVDDDENDRITGIGRVLRRTHLDELPQLWSILVGDMSVVGPRAVWTAEEALLAAESEAWRKRWFVRPGLTGLAQVNDAASTDPAAKLRYDVEYVRRQSFRLDLKLVVRQVWKALAEFGGSDRS